MFLDTLKAFTFDLVAFRCISAIIKSCWFAIQNRHEEFDHTQLIYGSGIHNLSFNIAIVFPQHLQSDWLGILGYSRTVAFKVKKEKNVSGRQGQLAARKSKNPYFLWEYHHTHSVKNDLILPGISTWKKA